MNKAELAAGLEVVAAMAETVRELKEVPSGTLYAHVMGQLSLESYEKVIGLLKRAGVVEETPAHLLRWVG